MLNRFDPQALVRRELIKLEEYTPVQPIDVLSQRLGIPVNKIVKLDANENPYGPISAVAEALGEYGYYHIYPDPQQTELREALSEFTGMPAQKILPTHGADEMIDYLCRYFLTPFDSILNCPPTFGMYDFDAKLSGAKIIDVPRIAGFDIDVARIKEVVAEKSPKLLFLTSPNNPSGNWLSDEDLAELVALPVMVILDEAYVEFADQPSRVSWVENRSNLIVLRTFSKAAGMAGLRLGYSVGPPWLINELWKFKQPYNVNVAASVAGLASLRHIDEILAVVEKIKQERARLYDLLQAIPYLQPHPSQSNFILCQVVGREAAGLKQALEASGILVRYYNKAGLEDCIRISVGRPEQTDRLMDILQSL